MYNDNDAPGGRVVTLHAGYYPYPRPDHSADLIKIYGFWRCTGYIETFRNSITRLQIDYAYMSKNNAELLNRHVAAYCGERLIELRLSHWNSNVRLDSFTSYLIDAFDRVTTLAIEYSDLTNQFEYLGQCFPNVTRYEHYHVEADLFQVYFGRLEILDIKTHKENIEPLAPLMLFNNEVRHLEITWPIELPMYSLLNMIGNNRTLDTLDLNARSTYYISDAEIEPLIREHPTLRILALYMVHCTIDQVQRIIENLNLLEDFTYRPFSVNDENDLLLLLAGTEWQSIDSGYGHYIVRIIKPQN